MQLTNAANEPKVL